MEGNNIQGSLDRLQQILSGRTITDLLSIVDPKQLPQPTTEDAPKIIDLDSNQATLADKIKTKDENKEKKKKKKKKEKKEKKEKDPEKKKKIKNLRYAAGEVWEDQSMEDWPDNDYRIFCGNLGNEVTDEMLALSFRKYPSFNRAKVVRDRKTSKTKGFGFVSIMRAEDYMKAMKEMDGQYIGNRPVKLTRSKWKDRSLTENKDEVKEATFKKVKRN